MGGQVVWAVTVVLVVASLNLQRAKSQLPPSLPSSSPPVNAGLPPPPSLPSTLTPPVSTTIPPPPSLPSISPPPASTTVPSPPSLPSTPPAGIPPPPALPSAPPLTAPPVPSTPNLTAPPLAAAPPVNLTAPPLAVPPANLSVPPLAAPPLSLSAPPLPSIPSISPIVPTGNNNSRSQSPETFIVGDTMGWIIPTGGSAAYATWAADKTFLVGDTLLFNFTTGEQDVAVVTKSGFEACSNSSSSSSNGSLITTGPAKVVLDREGDHYYICTFTKHCQSGQKLAINVTGTATPPSASPPTSPPPPSSAPYSGIGVTGFCITLFTTIFPIFIL